MTDERESDFDVWQRYGWALGDLSFSSREAVRHFGPERVEELMEEALARGEPLRDEELEQLDPAFGDRLRGIPPGAQTG